MKKILFLTTAIMATGNTFAITLDTAVCYLSTCTNQQTPDSTCDNICSFCSGTATTPDGYVYQPALSTGTYQTSFTRQISLDCGESTYSCNCGVYGVNNLIATGTLVCDTGYYGTPTYTYTERYGDYFAGCYRCPSSGGVYGTTAGPGATSVTECFIPSGNTFSDDSGSGEYSGDCYYTN